MFSHHLSSHEANELSAWLRLSLTDGVGNETARQWLAAYGLPQAIFEADPDALSASPSERLRRAIETVPEALPALLASTLAGVLWETMGPAQTFLAGAGFAASAALCLLMRR